ncbi:acetyl-CoA carboxylase, biotin carboxyl carrier protein [Desulfuribacillus stibiiarsenatis]|uniref:Biotin carboxyl carrier protein of acetyl-CoA carboxylase n=1 Tax=Desulfuribacillus stibiiarsenatis TaxID=1390249 RepID=A0A1E5L678_9FIRM|nr:acetyl-CoA carboxylase biotin carboxyl carrier protein [Desulfuribacillus stibiiarsenatis]OEH85657.1 acetyl-CoA carboxylase, biotin carboxyl carrier protein [Desulfuribacillus stibiiarsenatis]
MFNISEIRELIKLLDSTNITELEVENDGSKLSIKKNKIVEERVDSAIIHNVYQPVKPLDMPVASVETPAATAAVTAAPATTPEKKSNLLEIKSPMVGTFYSSPSPDAAAYVKVGDKVSDKDTVCIVEAMKLMNEIEAECRGTIVEVCVENGQLVEYGQTLFKVSAE